MNRCAGLSRLAPGTDPRVGLVVWGNDYKDCSQLNDMKLECIDTHNRRAEKQKAGRR
jgi:hypothetical protein